MARNMKMELHTFSPILYQSKKCGHRIHVLPFYLVYIWHCRIKLFLRHLPNCPCSNFSLYVDLFQEISPRIARQLRNFEKGMIYMEILKKRGVVEKRGEEETKSMPHAPVLHSSDIVYFNLHASEMFLYTKIIPVHILCSYW
jgi:hypothetical protein